MMINLELKHGILGTDFLIASKANVDIDKLMLRFNNEIG